MLCRTSKPQQTQQTAEGWHDAHTLSACTEEACRLPLGPSPPSHR
jgi:hypothetical protein